MNENRGAIIAAALILAGFGIVGFFLPALVTTIGEVSTTAAIMVAILFVAAFFLVFWLRARSQRRKRD
ncbi:hypothetical protein [Chelativorans sp. YIM 93263]|uniref:hypothetical protein n=1 Tax=Chelativorans sp. YIM 93263 TaxID=2906648 RepID=UPI002379FF49|nr:hypothetical protein [Chelativorans sp. YIM 93263]